eukprot:2936089-Alexandrium_andersonii.AAC.1
MPVAGWEGPTPPPTCIGMGVSPGTSARKAKARGSAGVGAVAPAPSATGGAIGDSAVAAQP